VGAFFPITAIFRGNRFQAISFNSGLPFVFYIYFLHNEPADPRIGRKTQGVSQ
jgi:hypothetical protein